MDVPNWPGAQAGVNRLGSNSRRLPVQLLRLLLHLGLSESQRDFQPGEYQMMRTFYARPRRSLTVTKTN
jgi:hypothetical protein